MVLPEITIKKVLDKIIKFYYLDYKNTNQANHQGTVKLKNGFNWNTINQQLIINGVVLNFIQQTSNLNEIITYFNTLINNSTLENIVAYNAGGKIGLVTNITDGSIQTLQIEDSTAVDTFGFVIGTYTGTLDKSKTRLYLIFEDVFYDNYNWLEETWKILQDTFETRKRPIKIYQHYNKIPYTGAINVIISFTNEKQGQKNIGVHEEKYVDPYIVNPAFDKYGSTYLLHITSDNYNEVYTIYTFLKAAIRANYPLFSFNGLDDFKLSGGNPRVETVMLDFFDFGLEISFDYHYKIPIGFSNYYPVEVFELNLTKINDQDIG